MYLYHVDSRVDPSYHNHCHSRYSCLFRSCQWQSAHSTAFLQSTITVLDQVRCHHGRYLYLSVDVQGREMISLPAEQLHLRAKSLAARFQQGGGIGCIDGPIILGREALDLCPSGHPKRNVSLTWLAYHLGTRYVQLGGMRDVEEAAVLDREALDLHRYALLLLIAF